ncbi:Ig kappa chain V region S211 [Oryzias melastigma]|uniref:Ig kappa chain V region S211 n=1 Tax=Oryzias melastigma TaxID=30732 RepID=A0A834F7D9_ORYME|nr:Ig kappa chain V region S211 [Oryzias melastigma]
MSLGVEVHQSPSEIITRPKQTLQISCSHSKTDYWLMLWYQRPPGDSSMKLIGYLYLKDSTLEEAFQKDFSFSGDLSGDTKKNSSLVIRNTEQNLNAVYYCAAREARQQKTPEIAAKTRR